MARRTKNKRVDKGQSTKYADTGRVFLASARALSTLGDEQAPYGNAIGLLAIHAAIRYSDAVSIAFGEQKSTGGHVDAADHLRTMMGQRLPDDMAKRLQKILLEKDIVSYQGNFYDLAEGRKLLKVAEVFCDWAHDLFQRRP